MTFSKKSDGIRRKSERGVSATSMPDKGASLYEGTRARSAGRDTDISAAHPSGFLDHWRESQEEENADANAGERAMDDAEEEVLNDAPDYGVAPEMPRISGRQGIGAGIRSRVFGRPHVSRPRTYHLMRWGVIAGIIMLIGLGIAVSTLWARVTIAFKPRIDDVALQDIAVVFDTTAAKADAAHRVIPAEVLSFSKKSEQSFSATGKRDVADRARGTVKITNNSSSSPQPLVSGTRFLTDGGVLYRLSKSVVVPGAKIAGGVIVPQSIDVEVVADAPGERANVSGSVALKIPGLKGTPNYDGFSAIASQGFAGGFKGVATVVSADDLKNAQEQVTKQVFDDLKAEMGRKIPSGFSALKELQNVEIVKVDAPGPGARLDRFSVSADAAGKALIFREEDAVSLATSFALADASDQEFVAGSAQLQYRSRSVDFDRGKADMTIAGNLKTRAIVHEEELAALVAGKKEGSIADILRGRHELADSALSFFPPWRTSAPGNPTQIHFRPEGAQ